MHKLTQDDPLDTPVSIAPYNSVDPSADTREVSPKEEPLHPNKQNVGRPRRHKRIFRMTH